MAPSRVSIEAEKSDLFNSLKDAGNDQGIFKINADLLTFAAALGFKERYRVELRSYSRRNPDPVPQDQFRDAYIINLIAVLETDNPKILASDEECDRERIKIFQEYVNGGLEILQNKLRGVVPTNYLNQLLLILSEERFSDQTSADDELDFTTLL